ncbi:MAG: hypothetical protein VCA34_06005, partial [Roseibacillus sp.]
TVPTGLVMAVKMKMAVKTTVSSPPQTILKETAPLGLSLFVATPHPFLSRLPFHSTAELQRQSTSGPRAGW